MNLELSILNRRTSMHRGLAMLLGGAAIFGMGACISAGAEAYNPDNLPAMQVERVAQICQTTIGLSPSEPPVLIRQIGARHLDRNISRYQGCIASLSDSVQHNADSLAARQAHAACVAKGLKEDTPEIAMCVLDSANSPGATAAVTATVASAQIPDKPAGSYFYASGRELRRREQVACAQIGLDPQRQEFDQCVKDLKATFFVLDNPLT
jgi:hypothetical protein